MSLANHSALDTIVDYAEIGLDSFIGDSLLSQIPIIGTLNAVVKTGSTIRDGIFIRKIRRFSEKFEDITEEERQEFLKMLDAEGSKQEVAEKLIMIIDRQDDLLKIDIIAAVFKARVRMDIDKNEQDMLFYCIGQAYGGYLQSTPRYEKGFESSDTEAAKALHLAGLAEWDIAPGELVLDSNSLGSCIHYKLNRYGTLLAGLLNAEARARARKEE